MTREYFGLLRAKLNLLNKTVNDFIQALPTYYKSNVTDSNGLLPSPTVPPTKEIHTFSLSYCHDMVGESILISGSGFDKEEMSR